jgi:putative polysaccharide biosynthesis protein
LILAVTLMVPLIKAWGLPGAALAMVVGLAITRLYALLMVARFARTTLTCLLPLRWIGMIVFYSLIAALPVYIMKWNLHVSALVFVGGALLVYGSIYLLLIWSSGLIRAEEKSLVVEYCSRLRTAFTGCSI